MGEKMGYIIMNCKNDILIKGYYIPTKKADKYLTQKAIDFLEEDTNMELL